MLAFPIALVLLTVSFLGWAPSVTADVLERLQCWCRNRASNSDAHNDHSLLQIVYHNNLIKNPVYIEHQCGHGYCVGIVGEPLLHQSFCTRDHAHANKFCYHRHILSDDGFSVNGEERALHVGKRQKDRCKDICRHKFGLPVSAGPFAPKSRKEVFTLDSMDDFIKKASEPKLNWSTTVINEG